MLSGPPRRSTMKSTLATRCLRASARIARPAAARTPASRVSSTPGRWPPRRLAPRPVLVLEQVEPAG
eukprot:12075373-Heterocapsa_arctica.AAC.1